MMRPFAITEQGLQLNRLRQLTGLSDPVYAEAYVQVHVYDIVLDVLVINQVGPSLFFPSLSFFTSELN